jgi:type IV secretory pathway VirD2 relaxase
MSAAVAQMVARMRADADQEAASRARRRRRLDDDWGSGGGAGAFGTPGPNGGVRPQAIVRPLDPGPVRAPVRSSFVLDEPPRGRAARPLAAPSRPRVSVGGGTRAERLAAGYQPVVLKVISYGHGVSRATAMSQYVQRDEVALETHTGQLLRTHEAVAAEMRDWARDFDKRKPSDDVAAFRLSVAGEGAERLVSAVEAAFVGHRYAVRFDRERDGSAVATVVATMTGLRAVRGEDGDEPARERFHLSEVRGERQFTRPTREAIVGRVAGALGVPAETVSVVPDGEASHGKAGVVYQLSRLASRGDAIGDDGRVVATEPQVRATAQAWNRELNSFTPRDVMHMILSAKAGEDKDALVATARSFLHAQLGAQKFAFALHDDKEADGHMHVHVVMAVKGEDGQKLRPGPADLRVWREVYAEHAQAHGMKIVATSAAYRASSQSYGPRDRAIVDVADQPREGREARDRAYAQLNPHVVENARRRIERAQANPVRVPTTAWELQGASEGLADWRAALAAQPDNVVALRFAARLEQSSSSGRVLVALSEKASSMADATAAEMRENLRDLNDAVAVAAGVMDGVARTEFLRRTAETMERIAIQTDLKAEQEKGRTHMSEAEARRMLGPDADALIARAREIQAAEELEAQRAETVRARAIEEEVRDERSGSSDPASLQEIADERAAARHAETIAARERQEAQAAAEAARTLAENPRQKLDPNAQGERLEELKRQHQRVYNKDGIDITGADEEPQAEKPSGQKM